MWRKLKQIKLFAFLVAVSRCSLFSLYFQQRAQPAHFAPDGQSWVVLSPLETQIRRKIEAVGTPLKEWDVNIYRGILTGFNDAFVIDEKTKNSLIDKSPKSVEIIRPILRGRDIKRYRTVDSRMWIIFARRGIDIKCYPAIEQHLMQHYENLKPKVKGDKNGRKAGSYKWYEIQDNVAFYNELLKPKIVWGNLNNEPSFAADYEGNFIASPSVILIPSDDDVNYLLAFLNSTVCNFFVSQLSYSRENGYIEYQKQFVEQLPVPKLDKSLKLQIVELAEKVTNNKKHGLPTTELEREIDVLIFSVFKLNIQEQQHLTSWNALS